MIDANRYRQITGDHTSTDAEIDRCVTDAQALLEEYLGRPLQLAERTEAIVPDRNGMLWPRVTPIVEAEGWTIDGLGLVGTAVWFGALATTDVTYRGGWERPDAEDPEGPVLPTCIQRDLAGAAYRLAHPQISTVAGIIPGAESVRLGDAAVTGKHLGGAEDTNGWWSRQTRAYRHTSIGTRPPTTGAFV